VLTGLKLFHTLRDTEILHKVIQGERPPMPTNASDLGISDELWQLLARCWNTDRNKRPQIDEVLQHLCDGPARELIFPPSRPSQSLSWENFPDSGTHEHGTSHELELVRSRAHSFVSS